MKRKKNHEQKKENHENKYNVEIQKFYYSPQKLMSFSLPTSPYFSTSLFLPLRDR